MLNILHTVFQQNPNPLHPAFRVNGKMHSDADFDSFQNQLNTFKNALGIWSFEQSLMFQIIPEPLVNRLTLQKIKEEADARYELDDCKAQQIADRRKMFDELVRINPDRNELNRHAENGWVNEAADASPFEMVSNMNFIHGVRVLNLWHMLERALFSGTITLRDLRKCELGRIGGYTLVHRGIYNILTYNLIAATMQSINARCDTYCEEAQSFLPSNLNDLVVEYIDGYAGTTRWFNASFLDMCVANIEVRLPAPGDFQCPVASHQVHVPGGIIASRGPAHMWWSIPWQVDPNSWQLDFDDEGDEGDEGDESDEDDPME
jgi:hypothetical protein